MLGLQIDNIVRALIVAGVEISDEILLAAQTLRDAAYTISTECMEEERFLQGRIEFVYVRYDAETDAIVPDADPQPTPVETPRKFLIDDRVMVRDGHTLAGMVGSIRDVFGGALIGRCEVELDDYGLHMIPVVDLEPEPEPAD